MISLYRKELRTLLPLQILMVLTNSGDLFYRPIVQRLDEASWAGISGYLLPGEGSTWGLALLIFGLLVAYSLFPREHDDRTIDFLYSLPVSRRRIFAAKTLAGWTVLVVGCLVLQFTDWLLQSTNPQSYSGEQWRFHVSATATFIHCICAGIVLCHGLLISFLRRFGLIPYAILGWIVISLGEMSPTFAWLDFMNLFSLEYESGRVLVPWGELGFHAGVALVALGLAYFLWMGRAETFTALWRRLQQVTGGKIALGCATFIVVFAFLGLIIALWGDSDPEEPSDGPTYVSYEVDRTRTERFDFTYPANMRGRALPLIRRADEMHGALQERLGAAEGALIVVDLTEQSAHHEGITSWTKIRVGLLSSNDDQRLLRTFVHELVHAFQFQESQRRLGDNARAARFFGEGSAEYLAFQVIDGTELHRASRRAAYAAWERHRIRFDVLADDDRLRADYDPHLVYALGETWTAALVEACGPAATGNVLRAMARDGAPRDLAPLDFWQDTLQAIGCDLEQVLSVWATLMEGGVDAESGFLAALPRLGGGVAESNQAFVIVEATLDRPPLPAAEYPAVAYVMRIRDNPGVDDTAIRAIRGEYQNDGRRVLYRVPRELLRGRRFQFQLGIEFYPESWAWWESWQFADVP